MKKLLLVLVALLLFVPTAKAADTFYIDGGSADRVHLRETPSQTAESLGLYFSGTDVSVAAWYDEWAKVKIGEVSGYVMSRYLVDSRPAYTGPWQTVANKSSTWVNVRLAPSKSGKVALRAENGTVVRLLGETADGWSLVECRNIQGYIQTDMLVLAESGDLQPQTTILAEAGWGKYIHQYVAPNGQSVYFVAELSKPRISFEDVNFDHWEDLVIMTMTSAKSTAYQFFVYDEQTNDYVYVHHTDYDGGLINYVTYPQQGLIGTHATSGYAGLLHVTKLYAWEENDLRLIRSAVSDEWSETILEGESYTNIIHGDMLHVKVCDYANRAEGMVLYERVLPLDEADAQQIFEEETNALWQGIK